MVGVRDRRAWVSAAPGVGQPRLLYPVDVEVKAEPYLIKIISKATLPGQFFSHKGEELATIRT